MLLDFTTLAPRDAYQWLTSTVMPRPIAWVSTVNASGATNLAPFSFFQAVCASPPTLMFVPATTREGRKKDTLLNIEQVPEFVVNLVSDALASRMNDTASLLPYGESEFEAFGISPLPSTKVKPPRVSDSPVSFECVLDRIVTIGSGPFSGNVVFGRVVAAHVRDDVVGVKGLPESAKLDLVGRLGGEDYTRTRDTFGLRRPDLR